MNHTKPTLFIGSSTEGLPWAIAAQAELDRVAHVARWDQGNFHPNWNTFSSLIEISNSYDFALFIASSDDVVRSRGKQYQAVRDNILFEYGLFLGKMGLDRVFYLYDRDNPSKIPSDLLGFTCLNYQQESKSSIPADKKRASLGPACHEIRRRILEVGVKPPESTRKNLKSEIIETERGEEKAVDSGNYCQGTQNNSPTILVIEDRYETTIRLAKMLYFYDYHVVCAFDGFAGLQLAKSCNPDLVLIDVGLPSLDGLSVCKSLKSSDATQRTPVVLLTAYTDVSDELEGLKAGADDYIPKPVSIEILNLRLKRLLNK